jgi:lipoprotein-anchoring transpeptidase ErfK/SrfK
MGDGAIKNNISVQCNKDTKTAVSIESMFVGAVEAGKDKYLGSVGGYNVSKEGEKIYGQLKLTYIAADHKIHLQGQKGLGYDVPLAALPADAIKMARAAIKGDAKALGKMFPLDRPCLKPAPVSKVGRTIITDKMKPIFVPIPKVKNGVAQPGEPAYFVGVYKTTDKYAVGISNGTAVTIDSKLNDSDAKRAVAIYEFLNENQNKWFDKKAVTKYSKEEVAALSVVKSKAKAKAPTAKVSTGYTYVPSANVKPLDDNFALSKDVSGKLRAIKVFAYGEENFAIPTADGRLIGLKTTSGLENPDISARAEIAEILKKNEIKLLIYSSRISSW